MNGEDSGQEGLDPPADDFRAPNEAAPSPGKITTDPRLIAVAKALRKVLPGDSQFGDDPLSTSGDRQSQVLGRRLAEATEERPSVLREAGLTALQVWQAMSQGAGRLPVHADMTIAFTDLVNFSKWSMRAGDDAAVSLLRDVSTAIEPPVRDQAGEVIKRLGDGMMAAFVSPADGIAAMFEALRRLQDVSAPGYRPRLRAGLHTGRPERVGDDLFGVDVNVAARVAEAAAGDEVLVTDRVLSELEPGLVRSKRKLLFRAKGVPGEIKVYSVRPGNFRTP